MGALDSPRNRPPRPLPWGGRQGAGRCRRQHRVEGQQRVDCLASRSVRARRQGELLEALRADVAKLIKDPKNWAMQAGNFENQRYSTLNQINKKNVKDLRVAWTFSTGVLRGHEGGPLVIGGMLFVHSPFPNKVFAIDLETQKIVNALPPPTKVLWVCTVEAVRVRPPPLSVTAPA